MPPTESQSCMRGIHIFYTLVSFLAFVAFAAFLILFFIEYDKHKHNEYFRLGIVAAVVELLAAAAGFSHTCRNKTIDPKSPTMILALVFYGVGIVAMGMLVANYPGVVLILIVMAVVVAVCLLFACWGFVCGKRAETVFVVKGSERGELEREEFSPAEKQLMITIEQVEAVIGGSLSDDEKVEKRE